MSESKPCMVCGQPGAFCLQPVFFMGDTITYRGEFCRSCQERLANATRFFVERQEGGWAITPVDEDGLPLLRRQQ